MAAKNAAIAEQKQFALADTPLRSYNDKCAELNRLYDMAHALEQRFGNCSVNNIIAMEVLAETTAAAWIRIAALCRWMQELEGGEEADEKYGPGC
jgi:hypothetical protein